jgi:hypothetical protein
MRRKRLCDGELKQGKLAGKFDAGHMQGTWQAKKKN